jgi:hypothetical protein
MTTKQLLNLNLLILAKNDHVAVEGHPRLYNRAKEQWVIIGYPRK